MYSTGFKKIEKINVTAPQPQRNVLKYFAIFKNVAHSLEPGETPSKSQKMMKLCQKINLHEPQRNRNATAKVVNLIRTSTVLVPLLNPRLR